MICRRVLPIVAILGSLHGVPASSQTLGEEESRTIRSKIDDLLKDELTRLWYPRSIDRQLGGFHQNFSRDWTPLKDDNRALVYQSRMTWTAAAFSRYDETHRQEFKKYATYGVNYLDQVMRDAASGGFHWNLSPEGKLDPRIGDEKHVYGTAFVLYAASEAFEATADPLARKVARDAFDWLEKHAHDDEHGGYFEAIARDGTPILGRDDSAPLNRRVDRLGIYYGFKSMNAHIHLLEAVSGYYRIEKTPIVETRLRELLGIVRDRIAVEPGALNLYLTRDWKPAPAHDSFGHDVETAYLLVEAAETLGMAEDSRTWKVARMLVDHTLDWGWDAEHGGFYDKGDAFAGQAHDTTKVWWTQAEGLNALMLMHKKFGADTDRYASAFRKQWAFLSTHLIDGEHGGWFYETTREGKLIGNGQKASQWKANYHTSRALMNVARMLGPEKK